ncbi:putative GTP-binding protein 6, partial [Fasciolopsis buskii]
QVHFNLRSVQPHRRRFFTEGVWQEVTRTVRDYCLIKTSEVAQDTTIPVNNPTYATAVFFNWPRLRTEQVITMQEAWSVPVYDRYTLVVQLFTSRARTREAKVQAQLAELILVRARLPILFGSSSVSDRIVNDTPFGGSFFGNLSQILKQKESLLMGELDEIERNRRVSRKQRRERKQHQLPIVTVVGYTNAGKTSLIHSLTKSTKLTASPQVFATLDITHHRTRLSAGAEASNADGYSTCGSKTGIPGIQLLLLDTIGFMADLPTSLIAAFRATLDECLDTDLILHLVDISEAGWEKRLAHVDRELCQSGVHGNSPVYHAARNHSDDETRHSLNDSRDSPPIIRIGNKVDHGIEYVDDTNKHLLDVLVSTKDGTGIKELSRIIELELMKCLGWVRHTVGLAQGSPILGWLYANAMVTDVIVAPNDTQRLHVSAVFTPAVWKQFLSIFDRTHLARK